MRSKGDILIDDWMKHRHLWIAHGGRWIIHISTEQTLGELLEFANGNY